MKHRIRDGQTANLTCPTDVFQLTSHDMFHDMFLCAIFFNFASEHFICSDTICFTICLFISPDLDGYREHFSRGGAAEEAHWKAGNFLTREREVGRKEIERRRRGL